MTFADFAATEIRFRKHFRTVPRDAWHDDMVPLADFLALPGEAQAGKRAYIWAVDAKQQAVRLAVSDTLVASTEDRRDFWHLLRELAGVAPQDAPTLDSVRDEARQEVIAKLVENLYAITGGQAAGQAGGAGPGPTPEAAAPDQAEASEDYMAPWLDTDACTACDECTNLNPDLFAYNDARKAYIKDPDAGPFKDLVLAAERCTARVIHPGLPRQSDAADIDAWIERANRYN
jgi:pyruvate-ferredoxin/flavodoxin oxidoreductase